MPAAPDSDGLVSRDICVGGPLPQGATVPAWRRRSTSGSRKDGTSRWHEVFFAWQTAFPTFLPIRNIWQSGMYMFCLRRTMLNINCSPDSCFRSILPAKAGRSGAENVIRGLDWLQTCLRSNLPFQGYHPMKSPVDFSVNLLENGIDPW